MISFIINAIKIIFLLGFLILIHEAGHFLVAKFFKVKVNEFSLGFGKILYSKQRKETKYCIRAFPLGGFVSMEGEDEKSDEEGSFSKLSIPKRILIVAAGATVNIVFGLLVFFILACSQGNFYSTTVAEVVDTYAAESVGIIPGDKILEINNKKIRLNSDITEEVEKSNGSNIEVVVLRDGKEVSYNFKPTEKITKTIGIYLGNENSATCKIESIYENSPAEKSGVKAGDIITKVNGVEYTGDQLDEASEALHGAEGEKVQVEVRRGEEILNFDITRETVRMSPIEIEMLENNIGYMEFITFDDGIVEDFINKYNTLKEQGATSLIIDVRFNGGGYIEGAIGILDALLPKDSIAVITNSKANGEHIRKTQSGQQIDLPIVILQNEYSASATEILTGALKDHKRATIVGTTSYGKGVLQSVYRIDGAALKITTDEFFTPNRNTIHEVGIEPDYVVEVEQEYVDSFSIPRDKDTQLQKAIELLS